MTTKPNIAATRAWEAIQRTAASGLYSDLTIECGRDVHKVHRLIVCSRSTVLAREIQSSFKESEDRTIELLNDDPEAVSAMIEFLYYGDYEAVEPSSDEADDGSELKFAAMCLPLHVKVYYLAATYGIVDLEEMALRHLVDTLEESTDRVLSPSFREAARLACTSESSSDQQMRRALTDALSNYPPAMIDHTTLEFLRLNPTMSRWSIENKRQNQERGKATSPPTDESTQSRTTLVVRPAQSPQQSTPPPKSHNEANGSPGRSGEPSPRQASTPTKEPGRKVLTPVSRRRLAELK